MCQQMQKVVIMSSDYYGMKSLMVFPYEWYITGGGGGGGIYNPECSTDCIKYPRAFYLQMVLVLDVGGDMQFSLRSLWWSRHHRHSS